MQKEFNLNDVPATGPYVVERAILSVRREYKIVRSEDGKVSCFARTAGATGWEALKNPSQDLPNLIDCGELRGIYKKMTVKVPQPAQA